MWGFRVCLLLRYVALIVISVFVIISLRKRELVALLELYSCCHCAVGTRCIFLAVLWDDQRYVNVVFPGHIHLLFAINIGSYMSVHVLLNLLNELWKRGKYEACNKFDKVNNTRVRM